MGRSSSARRRGLVITADIPLAAEVIAKGGEALNPRGARYSRIPFGNSRHARFYGHDASSGNVGGGPPPLNTGESQCLRRASRYLARAPADGISGTRTSRASGCSYTELAADLLHAVVESYVLREGTDYGEKDSRWETKVAHVISRLKRGEARIVFDPEIPRPSASSTCNERTLWSPGGSSLKITYRTARDLTLNCGDFRTPDYR